MAKAPRKGLVQFRQPAAQLTADLPGDEQMRQRLPEMKANDGYQGSCGIIKRGKQS